MKKFLILLCACVISLQCVAQTTLVDSIFSGGQYRSYILYVPAIYNSNTAVPLVYNLHGYTSNAAQQIIYGDFRSIADTADFIVVQPNGTFLNGNRFWNAFSQGPPHDLDFLNALADSLKLSYNIDEDRLYMCGMSNGGIMSYYAACDPASRFAAIGSVTGTMDTAFYTSCNPSAPTPVMEIHGTSDVTVPYNGYQSLVAIDTVMKYWRGNNAADPLPVVISYPDVMQNDLCTATEYAWINGINNSEVVLVKINSGGHTWPGAPINIGVTNKDFNASVRLWKFFRRYRKSGLTSIAALTSQEELAVYPNPAGTYIHIGTTGTDPVIIIDMQGKPVKCTGERSLQEPVYIGDLRAGLYTVLAGKRNAKFVKPE